MSQKECKAGHGNFAFAGGWYSAICGW